MAEGKPKVLIADDDPLICQQLKWGLQDDFRVIVANQPKEVLQKYEQHHPPLVLMDLNFSGAARENGLEGLELLEKILSRPQNTKVIVITGQHEMEIARQALGSGAYDHLLKPFDIDEIRLLIRRALFHLEVERESGDAADTERILQDFGFIVGESEEMQRIMQLVKIVADTNATVLITGESGTGKEVIARYIHQISSRRKNRFVAINCGAIPAGLLESELFGHEKGAFTGATSFYRGKFELAHDGTLFLDEIAEMPLELQVKLLRFLQDHTIQRVGGLEPIRLNVRIIAATNKDLKEEVDCGRFREDLFYRLNVVAMEMPPLRSRGADIALLANHFMKMFASEYHKRITAISPKALKLLKRYPWPGNVRELENKIRKAVLLARHHVILPEDLDIEMADLPREQSYRSAMMQAEREILVRALRRHNGVISHIAEDLKLNRSTLYDLLKKHKLDHKKYRLTH